MSTHKRMPVAVLVASLIVLAVGAGPRSASIAQALPPAQGLRTGGVTIPYPGRLNNDAGRAVSDGAYDFLFAVYAAETGGKPVWRETQGGVAVSGGTFAVSLGSVNPISKEALDGRNRWLEVAVRGPGESDFTALTPRQVKHGCSRIAIQPVRRAGLRARPHWGSVERQCRLGEWRLQGQQLPKRP